MSGPLVAACGLISLLAAVFHVMFWRLFRWPEGLQGSGRLNAAITQVMNIMLIYVFTAYGAALLWLGATAPPLLLAAGGGFLALRCALQPPMFGMSHPGSKALVAIGCAGLALHLAALLARP
jgi:hypothetical protein